MHEFDNLIEYCDQQFKAIPKCQQCPLGNCYQCDRTDCYECLQTLHNIHNQEVYSCQKITYNYVLKHFHRYASEMCYGLFQLKNYLPNANNVRIASIGCGPCSELYSAALIYQGKDIRFDGFDNNALWGDIQQFNQRQFLHVSINYITSDFIEYMRQTDVCYDIMIMNYLLSDMAKRDQGVAYIFIDEIAALVKSNRISKIVINDIPLFYQNNTAYGCMERLSRQLRGEPFIINRFHFKDPNNFQPQYGSKYQKDTIAFPISQEAVPYEPFSTCGSIQMIIRHK